MTTCLTCNLPAGKCACASTAQHATTCPVCKLPRIADESVKWRCQCPKEIVT